MTSIVREALEAVAKGLVGVSGKAIVLNSDASVVLSKVAAALAALDATPGEGDKLRNALEYVREHLLADPCPIGRKHVKRVVDAALWSAAPLSGSVVK